MFRIERKTNPSHASLQKIISTVVAILVAGIFIGLCGYNPFVVYREMLIGSLGTPYNLGQTVQEMLPLITMGLGVAVCFKMNFINIGAEGQFCMGAVGATAVALFAQQLPIPVAIIAMFVAAFVCGGLWCMIAGVLKARWKVSETLVTLMLTYVALKLVSYLQYVKWKDPKSFGFPKIANYPEVLQFPTVFGIHCGWIIVLALVILVYILLTRTKLGYEISVMGDSVATAKYAGINTGATLLIASLLGGGICGLAGLIQAAGVEHTLNDSMSGGMGYTAIVIAYMANMNPFTIVLVSFLFSILLQGGAYMQISMQIPAATGTVVQGVILLFVLGSEFFTTYRIVRVAKNGGEKA